ncbi:MAG: GNAT family N-acetyltransferase [Deltaproteobacteria bacterium]
MKHSLFTSRLKLTVFSQSHLSELVRLNADPEVMRYFPATLNPEESVALLQRIIEHQRINGYSLFALHQKESDAFVGWCGLMKVPFSAHFTPAVEIGWRLNKIFWGKGLAPEAARSVLRFGFLELGLSEIVSFTAELNQPSLRVMQKIGMQCNPEDTFDHPKLPVNHPLQRHILYRSQKTDWLEHHESSEIS